MEIEKKNNETFDVKIMGVHYHIISMYDAQLNGQVIWSCCLGTLLILFNWKIISTYLWT